MIRRQCRWIDFILFKCFDIDSIDVMFEKPQFQHLQSPIAMQSVYILNTFCAKDVRSWEGSPSPT